MFGYWVKIWQSKEYESCAKKTLGFVVNMKLRETPLISFQWSDFMARIKMWAFLETNNESATKIWM